MHLHVAVAGARLLVLNALLIAIDSFPGRWTTISPVPANPNYIPVAVAVAEDVVFMSAGVTSIFDTGTSLWSNTNARPGTHGGAAADALTGGKLIISGGFPLTALSHIFDLSTAQWSAAASLPTQRKNTAFGSDGQKFWVAGGDELPGVLQEYDSLLDAWTTRDALPVDCVRGAGSSYGGVLFLSCPDGDTQLYSVTDDVWTTGARRPTDRGYLYDAADVLNGEFFVLGGRATTPHLRTFEKYIASLDQWTTLDPSPIDYFGTAVAITTTAKLVAVSYFPSSEDAHMYDLTSLASFQGDPLITAFSGEAGHVDLFPGVFNLFSSPSVLVNALVVDLPGLPAGEDMVMIGVAVVAVTSDSELKSLYCDTKGCDTALPLTHTDRGAALVLGGLQFEIEAMNVHVVDPLGIMSPANSSFLNLHISAFGSLGTSVGGLIGDVDQLGLDVVRSRLANDYYSGSHIYSVCLPSLVAGPLRQLRC